MMSIYQLSFICFKCFTILIDFCLRSFSSYGFEKWIDSHLNLAPLNPSWSPNLATSLGESVKLWNRHGEIANLRNPHLLRKTHQIGSLGHWVIGLVQFLGTPRGFQGKTPMGFVGPWWPWQRNHDDSWAPVTLWICARWEDEDDGHPLTGFPRGCQTGLYPGKPW